MTIYYGELLALFVVHNLLVAEAEIKECRRPQQVQGDGQGGEGQARGAGDGGEAREQQFGQAPGPRGSGRGGGGRAVPSQ